MSEDDLAAIWSSLAASLVVYKRQDDLTQNQSIFDNETFNNTSKVLIFFYLHEVRYPVTSWNVLLLIKVSYISTTIYFWNHLKILVFTEKSFCRNDRTMRTMLFLLLLVVAGTSASISTWKACHHLSGLLVDQSDGFDYCGPWCESVYGSDYDYGECDYYLTGGYCLCLTYDEYWGKK